jgi:hypothetical protein
VTLEDANGGKYQGYRTHYKWDIGMTVRDWRYVVRVANIDVTALLKGPKQNFRSHWAFDYAVNQTSHWTSAHFLRQCISRI